MITAGVVGIAFGLFALIVLALLAVFGFAVFKIWNWIF